MIKRCILLVLTASFIAAAAPIQWKAADGGNDHYYEYVPTNIFSGITFPAAKTAAEGSTYLGLTGYLVTITSAEENAFLNTAFTLLYGFGGNPGSTFWMGASDEQTDGAFRWVSGPEAGQTLSYTNFYQGQVDQVNDINYLVFFRFLAENPDNGEWFIYDNDSNRALGYVIEYGPAAPANNAVPEPSTLALAVGSLLALGALRSLQSRKSVC